jgi:Kdo2-lipid IVA lauroyltransferase/acyltransferase
VQNRIEYIIFRFFGFIFRTVGLKRARKSAVLLACLFYYLIPIRKTTVIENLTKAFPEKSQKEIRKTAFATYKSFSIALVEILLMPYMSRTEIENDVTIPEQVKNLILGKYNEGRGVILLSAHYGNWEYNASTVSISVNLPFYIIVKSQRNPYVNEWMNNARTRWLNKVVPLGVSIREIFRQLKEKHIVALIADQRGPSDGVRVNFFGRRVSVYPGPALLALKTKSPILYGIAVRQEDYTYKIYMEEVCMDNLPENDEEKIVEISQRHTDILEKYVRIHPEQWLWMHKRWKY